MVFVALLNKDSLIAESGVGGLDTTPVVQLIDLFAEFGLFCW